MKKYYIVPKARNGEEQFMQPQLNWSRIVGWLAFAAQAINFALVVFAAVIPADVAIVAAGVLAFIQAVTGRVQGSR